MELVLKRDPSAQQTTFGTLFVDGLQYCQTLEDEIRQLPQLPLETLVEWVERWKIGGRTAIPAGRYPIAVLPSPKFEFRVMPHLMNVPGFDYIMIHPLNVVIETLGCIGVGLKRGELNGMPAVLQSVAAFGPLFQRIKDSISLGEEVWITITNPPCPTT